MLQFSAGAFAIAGLIAATAPIIIHLLNRRRFRVLSWAAMDFLRQAVQRSTRVLQLRDLLLLITRVLAVVLFGLALARPYFEQGAQTTWPLLIGVTLGAVAAFAAALWSVLSSRAIARRWGGATAIAAALLTACCLYELSARNRAADDGLAANQGPVHAILVIDNSLSMGYVQLNRTLLELAKSRAAALIDRLPRGSRISVLPACGPRAQFSNEPYRTRQDALEALAAIEVVDRRAGISQMAALALEAQQAAPDLPAKRVIFFGDQQQVDWSARVVPALAELPDVQVVQVAADDSPVANAWVADVRLRDGVADIESSSTILVTIAYEGPEPRRDVQVTLLVDGITVASQTIDLQPGQRQVLEFSHRFDLAVEPGRPAWSQITASLSHDELPEDDFRCMAAPVLAALPVVFVDQYGADGEDPQRNRLGETYALRRLLAPVLSHESSQRELVQIRHTTLDRITSDSRGGDDPYATPLHDARLVVVAGASRPTPEAVEQLRQYVMQGGQLLIAAGADFDPAAWQEVAWQDGAGILPLPLSGKLLGALPRDTSRNVEPFRFDLESIQQTPYFQVENESTEALEDLYRSVIFFQAAEVNDQPDVIERLLARETARLAAEQEFLREEEVRARHEAQGQLSPSEAALRPADHQKLQEIRPTWLLWAERQPPPLPTPQDQAQFETPRVRARYTGGKPYLVERNLGRGRIVFVSSGAYTGRDWTGWNTMSNTSAMLVFDRLLRSMIESTLPPRNVATTNEVQIPIEPGLRRNRFAMIRPGWLGKHDTPAPRDAIYTSGEAPMLDGAQATEFAAAPPSNPESGLPASSPRAIEEPLSVEAFGAERFGLTVRDLTRRGFYRVVARRPESAAHEGLDVNVWEVVLAAAGPEEESSPQRIGSGQFAQLVATTPEVASRVRWVGPDDTIQVEGARATGQSWWWKMLLTGVLVCFLLEMLILAWARLFGPQPSTVGSQVPLSFPGAMPTMRQEGSA